MSVTILFFHCPKEGTPNKKLVALCRDAILIIYNDFVTINKSLLL